MKDLLQLNDDENSLYYTYNNIEDFIESFLLDNRSIGGLNGFVKGGPRAYKIFEQLQVHISHSPEHLEREIQRRVRAKALLRLHLAISRRYAVKEQHIEVISIYNDDAPDAVDVKKKADQSTSEYLLEVFTTEPPSTGQVNQEALLSDLLFACGISLSVATVESLRGTVLFDRTLRAAFTALVNVFTRTVKALR